MIGSWDICGQTSTDLSTQQQSSCEPCTATLQFNHVFFTSSARQVMVTVISYAV
jgi:hypothetical protein